MEQNEFQYCRDVVARVLKLVDIYVAIYVADFPIFCLHVFCPCTGTNLSSVAHVQFLLLCCVPLVVDPTLDAGSIIFN